LSAFAADARAADGAACDREAAGPVAFVFSGMGAQWLDMGRALYASDPIYRAAVDDFDRAFATAAGWSIVRRQIQREGNQRIHGADLAQPASVALQIGLAALWRHWGIEPTLVIGHSMGEISAAFV